jgi:hypothetical protein
MPPGGKAADGDDYPEPPESDDIYDFHICLYVVYFAAPYIWAYLDAAGLASARQCLAVLVASGVSFIASCGTDDGLGRRYPVSGTVTYNAAPLEKGMISFIPDDPKGVGANGAIENGSYSMSTAGDRAGARAGKYKVTITAQEDSYAKAKADFQKASGKADPGFIPKEFVTKAAAEAKNLIPAGYGDVRTTNLTAEVQERSTTVDFKLSDADAPPAPKVPAKGARRPGR